MKRYPHYWWNLKGAYCPSRIAVLVYSLCPRAEENRADRERRKVATWHLNSAKMLRGECVSYSTRTGESGRGMLGALAPFCNKKETTWVIIPNAVDGLIASGLFNALTDGSWSLCGKDWQSQRSPHASGEDKTDGLCCIEDPPTLILCRPTDAPGKILFLDTRNYGIDDSGVYESDSGRAESLLRGILSIVSTLRQDRAVSLRATAASQAVQILRTRYDCVRLHCHTHAEATKLERASYFGGRVEALRTGEIEGPVYYLDVRSMYPSVGLTLAVPVSIRSYTDEPATAARLVDECAGECVAEIHIREGGSEFPSRSDGEINYPHGDVHTCLAGPGLQRALCNGKVRSVVRAARYYCEPILAGFFRDNIALCDRFRAEGQTHCLQWAKRVGNSLIGKFGEPGRRWVGCPAPKEAKPEMGPYHEWYGTDGTRYRNIAWYTQRLEQHGESYWSMPAIAAWITSAARVRLWNYHQAAGRENVWYSDTDSLVTNETGFLRLLRGGHIRDGETGHLRLVGCYSKATIYGVRHYQFGDTITCAGVPHGSIREGETREDYFRRTGATATSVVGRLRRMSNG